MGAAHGQVPGPRVRRSVMRFCVCGGMGPRGARKNQGRTRNKTKRGYKITHRCPVSERACDEEFFFSLFFSCF